ALLLFDDEVIVSELEDVEESDFVDSKYSCTCSKSSESNNSSDAINKSRISVLS
ncbi:8289_t:CDS:2, partial [Racocetra persica]